MHKYTFNVWYGAAYIVVDVYAVESSHAYEAIGRAYHDADSTALTS